MENQIIVHEICPTTAQVWLKEGAVLVDVRENNEVAQVAFDVPNLIHIPLSEFEDRFQELPKDKKLVLACKAGSRSWRATAFLMHNDYEHVVNMKHGLERWVQKGFPAKGDTSTLTNNDSCCSNSACC